MKRITNLCDQLVLNKEERFHIEDLSELPLRQVIDWLDELSRQFESLPTWIRYRSKRDKLIKDGLKSVVDLLDRGEIDSELSVPFFELKYMEQLLREVYAKNPDLAEFAGTTHEAMRKRFQDADRKMIETNREEVAATHQAGIPAGQLGGMGVIRHEIQKKSRHMAIRRLLKEAGPAVQRIKPVFMMSPLSVAQYLAPGAVDFDLLLIDEASQIEPIDALGAAARCKQMVVVGDDKQLPPTRFFSKSADVDENDDSKTARDLESILGLCLSQGMRQKMLRWHYRSQHQSLIAVSNSEYYGNGLFVVPSPIRNSDRYGVHFVHVTDGIYDRGGASTNVNEARKVAEAVIHHAKEYPNLSLGVAAFSTKQRDAILDELELLEREHPEVFPFFQTSGPEPFFVKNLENVQGDERDVIFISVGYGKDENGYMTQNYGPLNRDGGERRLNVLISRSKQKCVVFSSITANEIDLQRARAKGVTGLKKFLQFAEKGYSDVGEITGRGFDSDFEREVATEISQHGYHVETQIGVAGFFIDLAIVDDRQPGRYLLGIECDGASYHSSRSARDRDRLREEVLKARGWKIHRIWSTDWYQSPVAELRKVVERIEELKNSEPNSQPQSAQVAMLAPVNVEPENEDEIESSQFGFRIERYVEAEFEIDGSKSIPDMHTLKLNDYCLKVIKVEGPIHEDEVTRRLASLTNSRAGSRIVRTVKESISCLKQMGSIQSTRGFLEASPLMELVVRDRSSVSNPTLRKVENIPDEEVGLALVLLLKENGSAERGELLKAAGSAIGIKRLTANFLSFFEGVLDRLIEDGAIDFNDGVLAVGDWTLCQKRFRMETPKGQLF